MSDLDRLIDTFSKIGIDYVVTEIEQDDIDRWELKYNATIGIEEGNGYSGFYCIFCFKNGKFINHSVLE